MKSHKLERFHGPRTEGPAEGVRERRAEKAPRSMQCSAIGLRPSTVSQAEIHTCLHVPSACTHTHLLLVASLSYETLHVQKVGVCGAEPYAPPTEHVGAECNCDWPKKISRKMSA